ncbi:MAG: type I-U CRISPR-associated protein Cas7 [Akkermansiaceae bacterium]|nr:type I-U CRISPR-associated protein Cas7 [Akkermansiaceae bacterium]
MSDSNELTYDVLASAVTGTAAAFRCRRRLQPGGGAGDKVFPPTFAGAVYATEHRRLPGREEPVPCVLLDSVQSQANRMELALQESGLELPLIAVDFSEHGPSGDVEADAEAGRLVDDIGEITSLQVPHRLADAILRDSELDGVAFRQSERGRALNTVSPANATALYQLCPTALVFGMWDSTGPKGGLGPKFERALVSEVVGIGASYGVRTSSRIDPLITTTRNITLYETPNGGWTLDEAEAKIEKGKPVKLGKDGKVSEANLGNVTPSFSKYTKGADGIDPLRTGSVSVDYHLHSGPDEFRVRNSSKADSQPAKEGQVAAGGVTIEYAEQVTTLSLICLRRLRFPVDGEQDSARDNAARAVLTALGLCAATLAFENGMGLRSRCLLWPEEVMEWELLEKPGAPPAKFQLTADAATKLLTDAVAKAAEAGLEWATEKIVLQPSANLLELVRRSQLEATKEES